MVKFKTVHIFGGGEITETVTVKTQEDFDEIHKISVQYREASLNGVELLCDGLPIMAVRNHVPELLKFLNGEADEFVHRHD